MYISKLSIKNFRILQDNCIEFNERINVIIGPNNCGKSTILTALRLLFDNNMKKQLSIDDFNKNSSFQNYKDAPPMIMISAILTHELKQDEELSNEVIPIATWLTKFEEYYEAALTYEFFLPEKYLSQYLEEMVTIDNDDDFWKVLESNFIKKYVYKFYIGKKELMNTVKWDDLSKFDFQFLSAIRDVEKDLVSGKKSLFKEVLEFFTDYDLKSSGEICDRDELNNEILSRSSDFNEQSSKLFELLDKRLKPGKKEILQYVEGTGASFDDINPDFVGNLTEKDLYSHMSLIIEDNDVSLPVELNGLGYNNLLYISLLLAKIQKDSSISFLGDNAKFYSILAIEEPEAHLHPNMQYKFLKFIQNNQTDEVNQIFITTHSPNITSAVDLDNLIVLNKSDGVVDVSYPKKAFNDNIRYKKHVERFLDVTKSDMFFASKLIFVEGLTEEILVPYFAEKWGYNLADRHISIINLNGRYFNPFLELFNPDTGVKKEVACITDRDCQKRKFGGQWSSCYSYELNIDSENYEYKPSSNKIIEEYAGKYENIKVFTQDESHTFEYDLILSNLKCLNLITSSMYNQNELKEIMRYYSKNSDSIDSKDFDEFFALFRENFRKNVEDSICNNPNLSQEEKYSHLIATRYVESIKDKGAHAQELSDNLFLEEVDFSLPNYLCEVIKWIGEK